MRGTTNARDEPMRGTTQCAADERRVSHGLVQLSTPHAADLGHDTHHDVQRLIGLDRGTCLMWRACARAFRLSSGAPALATATEEILLDVPLRDLLDDTAAFM